VNVSPCLSSRHYTIYSNDCVIRFKLTHHIDIAIYRRLICQGRHTLHEPLTLKQATGGLLPPSADFVEVRKLAKQIERQFCETLLTII